VILIEFKTLIEAVLDYLFSTICPAKDQEEDAQIINKYSSSNLLSIVGAGIFAEMIIWDNLFDWMKNKSQ
jgi:hypothetical protein